MVEVGDRPTVGVMACIARCVSQHMRWAFSSCDIAVMAGLAGFRNTHMGKAGQCPVCCRMTFITSSIGQNMRRMLTGSNIAVMTGFTSASDPFMGEVRNVPAIDGMAGITLCTGQNMSIMLAGCTDTIVATGADTGCRNRIVIKTNPCPGCGRSMADIALLIGCDMCGMFTGCDCAVMT